MSGREPLPRIRTSSDTTAPQPFDIPTPVSPPQLFAGYPPFSPHDEDNAALLPGGSSSPSIGRYFTSKINRRRPLQALLTILSGLVLLGFWFSGSLSRFQFVGVPSHPETVAQIFAPNPTRFIRERHTTIMPPNLPKYELTSWGCWANGTIEVIAAERDETDVRLEVEIEAPSDAILKEVKYDVENAKTDGTVSIRFSGRCFAVSRSKWLKIHVKLLLPRGRAFNQMELRFLSESPYWFQQHVDLLDTEDGISFKRFSALSKHGDINITALTSDQADIRTQLGTLRYGSLKVPEENLLLEAKYGGILHTP